ncbi:MAG: hypothetical protein HLX51_10085 [Micrococcaceae bacterium]|nr:hypothetical protein [Micrococcaceae bacterium]
METDGVDDAGLPRCTSGRGAAPMEDSGGMWGWSELVAAANDPTHEHYDDYREWLDLAEGETFDAK